MSVPTVRQDIRDAVIDLLNDTRPTEVPECTKRRYIPGERRTVTRLAAFFGEEDDARPNNSRSAPLVKHSLVLVLQGIVYLHDIEEVDDALEPMLVHIADRLGNTNLGGLALDVTPISTLWGSTEGDLVVGVAATRWRIEFQTRRDDLTRKQ